MTADFVGLVDLRLGEHAVHTWDVEVALDPAATVASQATGRLIDGLGRLAGFTARPTGAERTVTVVTTDPRRGFQVGLAADAVTFTSADPVATPDVELPAEAWIRLVYGRLDPDHTPAVEGADDLEELRQVFPGP